MSQASAIAAVLDRIQHDAKLHEQRWADWSRGAAIRQHLEHVPLGKLVVGVDDCNKRCP